MWPEVFFVPVPSELVGLLLAIAAFFLCIVGVVSVISAWLDRHEPSSPNGNANRPWHARLTFRSGAWILGEASLYTVLSVIIVGRGESLDLWEFFFLLGLGILALAMFEAWARDVRRKREK